MIARFLPFVLSVIAGATDITGVLGFNGLFTAHITGNLVLLAGRVVAGNPAAVSYILSVPVFMLVLLGTSVLARVIEQTGASSLRWLLLLQLLALVTFFLLSVTSGPWEDPDATLAVIAGMCGVMGVQNALAQIALKNTPTTAVMTTNITRLMGDLGTVMVGRDALEVANAKSRALDTLPLAIGFVLGCALGAAGEATVGLWSLSLPAILALIACVVGMGHGTNVRHPHERRQLHA
jgi:uncharacterized membrane protein YoaK (UPF0700 family)